jgi:hypothetical protein
MPLSWLPRAPLTSSRTAQLKGYVYLLSGPSPNDALPPLFQPCKTYLQGRLRVSLAAHPRAHPHPTSPPSTTTPTTLDGVTANADRTTFDAARARPFCSPPPHTDLAPVRSAGLRCQRAWTEYACAYMLETRGQRSMPWSLISASIAWAAGIAQDERTCQEGDRTRIEEGMSRMASSGGLLGSKL